MKINVYLITPDMKLINNLLKDRQNDSEPEDDIFKEIYHR